MAEKKKLDTNSLKSVVSASVQEKKYDLDLACRVLDLVGVLKSKLTEDYSAIEAIQEKLKGVEKANAILNRLNIITERIKKTEEEVNNLYNMLDPKRSA